MTVCTFAHNLVIRLYEGSLPPGTVTGLAWTSMGGSASLYRAVLTPQKILGHGVSGKVQQDATFLWLAWRSVLYIEAVALPRAGEARNCHSHAWRGPLLTFLSGTP
eukprot:6483180-Amphidinium_carterae.1